MSLHPYFICHPQEGVLGNWDGKSWSGRLGSWNVSHDARLTNAYRWSDTVKARSYRGVALAGASIRHVNKPDESLFEMQGWNGEWVATSVARSELQIPSVQVLTDRVDELIREYGRIAEDLEYHVTGDGDREARLKMTRRALLSAFCSRARA